MVTRIWDELDGMKAVGSRDEVVECLMLCGGVGME